MGKVITMSALVAMMLVPSSVAPVRADASISVSINFGPGYATCYDNDMDLDNVFVLDNSRIGVWTMLPSGRWVLRVRNIWWNADLDDWVFGPWSYDYSIAHCRYTGNHFSPRIALHPVLFHVYMNDHYRSWHNRYYLYTNGRYAIRYSRQKDSRYNRCQHARMIRQEPVKSGKCLVRKTDSHTTVVVHDTKQPVRIDGGDRDTRIDQNHQNAKRMEFTRSETVVKDNGKDGKTVTRTKTEKRFVDRSR